MSMWQPEDEEGPFSVDPPAIPYDWSMDDIEDPDEYVRVIRPKLSWAQRYDAWCHQRMLDGDYQSIDHVLTYLLLFPACVVGVYAGIFLLAAKMSPFSDDLQGVCWRVGVVCALLIGAKFGLLYELRRRVRQYTARLVDERWLVDQAYLDEGEVDDD